MEDLYKPTEVGSNVVHIHQIRIGSSGMDAIVLFLKEDVQPEEKSGAFSGPYLLCIHLEVVELLLEELHEGICGSHTRVDLCFTRPSLKAIGGQICIRKQKSM